MDIQYTDEQKARIRAMIQLFEDAKVYLPAAIRRGVGICSALGAASEVRYGARFSRARNDCCNLIGRALGGPAMFLGQWQRRKGFRANASMAARTAWLEQLIRDCKAAL
ncbi:hypothetical protein [Xanthomonas phage NEB7]|nr:hypothetical protein [Xanthomonas phage NEB7]